MNVASLASLWLAALTAVPAALVPMAAPPPVRPIVAALVNETARGLAERRGVRLGRPIAVEIVDRAELSAALAALSSLPGARERDRDREHDRERLLARLGLAPDPDARAAAPADPPADVGGLYDPARGRLLVGSFVDLATARFAVTRDAAHAVLDRRFGLSRWLGSAPASRAAPLNSDALWARQALLEGDATVQALEHVDRYGRLPSGRALAEVVESVRSNIVAEGSRAGVGALDVGRRLFVYLDGLALVAAVRARSPWAEVDALWARPPASTEQVLHPEKYLRRERSDAVAARLPGSLVGGWRVAHGDTLGELGVRLFLATAVDEQRAYRGAAGWGGDRALLFRRAAVNEAASPELLAAWITTWDHEAEAADFADQAARVLGARAGTGAAEVPAAGPLRLTDPAGRLHALERRGRTVALLLGAPADAAGALSELLGAATRGGRKQKPTK